MRIGLFTDDFLPRKSGVVTSTITLKSGLESLGHTVYVFAPRVRGYNDDDEYVIRVTSLNPLVFDSGRLALPHPRIVKKISALKLDIVHSETQFMMGILADSVAKKRHIPHVTTAHTIWTELLKHYPFQVGSAFALFALTYQIYFLERIKVFESITVEDLDKPVSLQFKKQMWHAQNLFFNNTDSVIVPSSHLMSDLELHGMKVNSYLIPNGIDRSIFAPTQPRKMKPKKSLRVLCVGRLSTEKRQNVLIEALGLANGRDISLTIVGEGPQLESYKEVVEELNLQDRVHFLGNQESEKVSELMQEHDVLALVSYKFDNQPMVILEAITAGMPVLYCDPQLTVGLTTSNSLLTKDESARSIALALIEYYEMDTKLYNRMSIASLAVAEQFSSEKFAQKTIEVYRRALRQG